MIIDFRGRYFRTVFNDIFSLSVVIAANFKRIQIIRKDVWVLTLIKLEVFKMLEVLDEIKNLSSWYEDWKMMKKLREKQKFWYPDNV